MVIKITQENFEKEVLQSSTPVLVDFFATWCGPCKMMAPVVDELEKEFEGKVKVGKVDIEECEDLAMKYRVMAVPTFAIFSKGEPVKVMNGALPKNTLAEELKKMVTL